MSRKRIAVGVGQKFNRLTIVSEVDAIKGCRAFLCQCVCGTHVVVRLATLRSMKQQSCGCVVKNWSGRHGHKKTPTNNSWCHMKARCNNKKHHKYVYYGGRGITYQPSWDKFINFLEDMGERPEGMTLDRIDVNGNYTKDNCRWATQETQQNNRRDNVLLTIQGRTITLSQYAREIGMSRDSLRNMLNKKSTGSPLLLPVPPPQ